MTQINKYFAGEDTFNWFIGVVESRQDPLELGRIKVRIFGVHTDSLTEIPSDDLPWAVMVQAMGGKTFTTPKESDVVVGFFLDSSKQLPCIWGVIPGVESNAPSTGSGFHDLRAYDIIAKAPKKPAGRQYNTDGSGIRIDELDVTSNTTLESLRHPNAEELGKPSIPAAAIYEPQPSSVIIARKNNLDLNVPIAGGGEWSEPYPAYNPEYPYDNVTETESGHIFELDDTPGSERVMVAHRSGSFFEYYPTGTLVEKITKSKYTITMADDNIHVMGSVNLTVGNAVRIKVAGDAVLEIGGSIQASVAKDVNFSARGSFNVQAESINLAASEDASLIGKMAFLTGSNNVDIYGGITTIGASGDLGLSAGGVAALGGATTAISGLTQIGTLVSVNHGAPTPGSASSGTPTGLPAAPAAGTPTTGEASLEETPIPYDLTRLDPITGQAYVYSQFKVPGANGTSAPADSTPIPVQNCAFDASTKTFIPVGDFSISQKGLQLIQGFEGFAKVTAPDTATAYPDPATGGEPLTIGYGTTAAALGIPVTMGELISRETAQGYLTEAINRNFLPTLKKGISVPLTQNMIDACLSFIYNVGPGNFLKSTFRARINQQMWCAAADAMLVWNKAAGQVNAGLTQRRTKERSLFIS